ncbi:DUF3086 domain-containing protein [Roseofilum sp. BLCC_M154]|uniref:DUF3086 domain-containing protein n=1 Tax=Roseofilum acuticapitatum BLCC-M154 TaxID=3022444 RepID=A0ABT7AQ76_9CYAN|nr:DUF3086 domain-containing protein [Roseofilum acuticapitatum]MDJ1169053.1 DUF3086 domain-containing protein [Roseofilum acuticapitatum BLCC-M154]
MNTDPLNPWDSNPETPATPPTPSDASEVSEPLTSQETGDVEQKSEEYENLDDQNTETGDSLLPLQLDTKTPDHPEPREEMAATDGGQEQGDGLEDQDSEPPKDEELDEWQARIDELRFTEQALQNQVQQLRQEADRLQEQLETQQSAMGQLVQAGLSELEHRKHKLEVTIEKLERRAENIRAEMRTSFAGVSQDLAIRIQGFKDYLVGSLQDLASAAENIELGPDVREPVAPVEVPMIRSRREPERPPELDNPQFTKPKFADQVRQIRNLLDQYRTRPDYYGPAWQLRRTFEPIHAERVSQWFFTQGGRGAVRTMGSRLQNILVASAVISVVYSLYGDRLRPLILVNTPERLGEWRRGLQDCLGISRMDFSSDRGITMFEAPEPLALKAERITQQKQLPLIIIDESEDKVSVSMLQFPLWLAFAPNPEAPPMIDSW